MKNKLLLAAVLGLFSCTNVRGSIKDLAANYDSDGNDEYMEVVEESSDVIVVNGENHHRPTQWAMGETTKLESSGVELDLPKRSQPGTFSSRDNSQIVLDVQGEWGYKLAKDEDNGVVKPIVIPSSIGVKRCYSDLE